MQNHRDRARSLLERMNIEEKAAQLYSVWLKIGADGSLRFRSGNDGFIKTATSNPMDVMKNGIGQITRPLGTAPIDAKAGVRGLNAIQKFLVEKTRLGIPALPHEECLPGLMVKGGTLFPSAINFGSLWDEDLMQRIASAIGDELLSVGSRQGLSPVLDVSRDVRWGRTEETFGEDPYLSGCMAVAYVKGLQGKDRRLLATLKHYAAHSFSEGARNHAPVRIGERELNDVFLLPFEMAVKLANAGSVMPAYHDIDGEPASSSRHLLTEVLREQWGFDGIVVSDYEAVSLLTDHHKVARDAAEATALAIHAGMDMELPGFAMFGEGIKQALDRGLLDPADVDAAVMRVVTEKARLGLFDRPYVETDVPELNTPAHRALARESAEKSLVLLKNDGMLPLADGGTTALIGPLADDQLAVFCGYSFPVHLIVATGEADNSMKYARTLRESMTERASGSTVLYSRGCDILTGRPQEAPVFPGDAGAASGQKKSYVSQDESRIAEAVTIASGADRIVVAVGDLAGLFLTGTVGEGSDAASLALPGVQQKLLDALLALGKPTTIVVLSGRPYNFGNALSSANAVLQAWLPGQEGADAIVGTLYGDVNPGGRMPVSAPRSAGAMPYFYNHKLKSAGTPVQPQFGAVFPFGHGLSYTSFEYSDFAADSVEVPVDGTISVSCTVRNVGKMAGDEVVQLYVRDLFASLVRPVKELKGFARVSLDPGKAKRIRFSLPVDMLGFTVSGTTRIVEPGDFELMLGSSSEKIHFRKNVLVTGSCRTLPENRRMRCETEQMEA